MKCNLCQKDTDKLVDSHIIAKSIHALGSRGEDTTQGRVISSDVSVYPKKSRTGVYDQIVCGGCEKIFQRWEAYALELFIKTYEIIPTNRTHINLSNYDYHKLKLFCLSVLWKADASQQHMYQAVNVGEKHRNILRTLLLEENPGSWQNYSIWMERFNSDKTYASAMRSPRPAKLEGVIRFYTFYMAGFKIHIKCDNRKVPDKYEVFMKENQPLLIPVISFKDSTEFREFTKLIHQKNNKDIWLTPPPHL